MAIVSTSRYCKGYCVDREDLIAAERRAKEEGLTFEFVAVNNGLHGWTVYPTEADAKILDQLQEASVEHHYEFLEKMAKWPEPGERVVRKSFPQRHPNLPLVIAICALIGSIIAPLLR